MELGARHSLRRRNMATRRHGILHGEPNADMLGECGHNDKELEMLHKEGILIKKED